MKILITLIIALSLLCGITQPVFAQSTTSLKAEDLLTNPSLTDSERTKLAKLIREKQQGAVSASIMSSISDSTKWQEVGKAFSETIKDVCQTLNVEVNQFIKSDVGKLTATIIVYKMIGKDIVRMGVLLLFMFGLTIMIFFSLYFVHGRKKWKVKDSTGAEHIEIKDRWIPWNNDDLRIFSVALHLIAWFVSICVATAHMVP